MQTIVSFMLLLPPGSANPMLQWLTIALPTYIKPHTKFCFPCIASIIFIHRLCTCWLQCPKIWHHFYFKILIHVFLSCLCYLSLYNRLKPSSASCTRSSYFGPSLAAVPSAVQCDIHYASSQTSNWRQSALGNPRGHEHSTEMQAFQHRKPLPRPHSHFKCSVIPSCLTKHFKWLAPVASPLAYYYFSMCSCAVLQDAILGQKMYMNVNCYGLTNQKRQCCHLFQKATSNSAINNQYDCQSIQGPGT